MHYLAIAGKFLVSVSFGILLFLVWILWGTELYTDQKQHDLAQEFERAPLLAARAPPGEPATPPGPPKNFSPGPGDAVFRLRIPAIKLSEIVVAGVGQEDLKKGPGHYPSCRRGFKPPFCTSFDEVFPGEKGRVVVSGHRTTYGAPFYDLDKVTAGQRIFTDTKWGRFVYRVREVRIVAPNSRDIVRQSRRAELVLTTCNPKYSAAQRLVVFADLEAA